MWRFGKLLLGALASNAIADPIVLDRTEITTLVAYDLPPPITVTTTVTTTVGEQLLTFNSTSPRHCHYIFLTYDTSTEPMTLLLKTFQELALNDSTYATQFALWVFAWWGKYDTKDCNVFAALWMEFSFAVVSLERTVIGQLQRLASGSPAFFHTVWTYTCLGWKYVHTVSRGPVLWFYALIIVPVWMVLRALLESFHLALTQPLWNILCGFTSSVIIRYFPRILGYNVYLAWSQTFHNHAEYRSTQSELRKAATMSPSELKQMVEAAQTQMISLENFSHTQVVELAKKTIAYRTTCMELIKDANWYRRVIDSLMNYRHNEKLFQQEQRTKSGNKYRCATYHPGDHLEYEEPYYSNTLNFTAEAHPTSGLHYKEARRTHPLFSLKKNFTSANKWSYYEAKHHGFKLFAYTSWFVNHVHMPGCFNLFENDPWALQANFPGIQLPEYKQHEDPIDLANRRPVDVEPLRKWGKLIEDFAAKGELLNWEAERLKPVAETSVCWDEVFALRRGAHKVGGFVGVDELLMIDGATPKFS